MIELPDWLNDFSKTAKCPNCSTAMNNKGVFGIGIREETIKNRKVLSFCFEYICHHCNNRTVFTGFPSTMEQFSETVDEIISKTPETPETEEPPQAPKKKKKPAISVSEIKKFSKELQNIQTHEEFLEKLGINVQELKKYKNEDK